MNQDDIVMKPIRIIKVKRGVPTVIRFNGQDYVLRPRDQFQDKRKEGERKWVLHQSKKFV